MNEGLEGRERGGGMREGTNEGVVHEGVGVGEVMEETERVVENMIGDGNGAVEKEFAEEERVSVKACNVEMSVDLFRGFEGCVALAQQ